MREERRNVGGVVDTSQRGNASKKDRSGKGVAPHDARQGSWQVAGNHSRLGWRDRPPLGRANGRIVPSPQPDLEHGCALRGISGGTGIRQEPSPCSKDQGGRKWLRAIQRAGRTVERDHQMAGLQCFFSTFRSENHSQKYEECGN